MKRQDTVTQSTDTPLVEQIIEKLHAEGGRMTPQRRLILEVLDNSPDHPTAEQIYRRALRRDASLHLSTVYRTLRWLEEEGFVNPRWFENERRQERFDTIDENSPNHHHFRCRICGRIVEFSEPLIETITSAYEAQFGGQVESATLTLYGVCSSCINS